MHDIGNPPFGHFGETAIRDWAARQLQETPDNSMPEGLRPYLSARSCDNYQLLETLMKDFIQFDGNPQGFRNVTKLHTDVDEYGLNLTYATLLCILKYARCSNEEKDDGIRKKAGHFQTEHEIVEHISSDMGLSMNRRYPLTYIMEAADDIAYCMSDIADGIEKKVLTEESFIEAFRAQWETDYPGEKLPVNLPKPGCLRGFSQDISIPWSRKAMEEAQQVYFDLSDQIYEGTAISLMDKDNPMGKVLETVKRVSREKLYSSMEAESIELSGYAIITGILQSYERLLRLPYDKFNSLVLGNSKDLDVEKRLYHRLGTRYIKAYTYAVEKIEHDVHFMEKEWWLRVHLVVDHISGMTDEYALQTYQMLRGINLLRQ